jgi:hypothetical protein
MINRAYTGLSRATASGCNGSVSSDPLQALRILIWLLRVIGQTLRIHTIEYTDTMYQLD